MGLESFHYPILTYCLFKTGQWNNTQDESGAFLIDRSPVYFEIILDYLRHGILILGPNINPEGMMLLIRCR